MEISLLNKETDGYREIAHIVKRVQESLESVVPDTNDDIGRIADVQTEILLKSKDVTSHGVSVTGEINASVIYINENADKTEFLKVSSRFSMDFEISEADADMMAQITLAVVNSEARALNPRKISVLFEISGELSCYRPDKFITESSLPEDVKTALHTLCDKADVSMISAICEKTFTFAEQYPFSAGKPKPERVIAENVIFSVSDTQFIGSKALVKGNVRIQIVYQGENTPYPLNAEFSSAFSQLVDTLTEASDSCSVKIIPTSTYFELVDTISDERVLDAELHAVIQLVCRSKKQLSYVADAYSNMLPIECKYKPVKSEADAHLVSVSLSASERLNIAEDCTDVLAVFTGKSEPVFADGRISIPVPVDIIYTDANGAMNSVRRVIEIDSEIEDSNVNELKTEITDAYFRPNGLAVDCSFTARASYLTWNKAEFEIVSDISASEDEVFDSSSFPSVTLIRSSGESLWQLAKKYHSTVDRIEAVNELEGTVSGKILLIPKAL